MQDEYELMMERELMNSGVEWAERYAIRNKEARE